MIPGYFVTFYVKKSLLWRFARFIRRYNPEQSRNFPIWCHNSPALPKLNKREITTSIGFLPHMAMVTHAQLGQLGSFGGPANTANWGVLGFCFSCFVPRLNTCYVSLSQEGKLWSELSVHLTLISSYHSPFNTKTYNLVFGLCHHVHNTRVLLIFIFIDKSRKQRVWNKRVW